MLASSAASVTVTEPVAADTVSGSAVPKNGTFTAPLTPAAPSWMWLRVGAPMPFQATANDTRLPWTRNTSTARPSGSPTFGPPGVGTSLRPVNSAARNVAGPDPVAVPAAGAGSVRCSIAWSIGAVFAAGT